MSTVRTDSVLDRIVELKRQDLAEELVARPLAAVRAEAEQAPPARGFAAALRRGATVSVVAEIKRASPSRGVLSAQVDPAELAGRYQAAGADAISVLTERHRFLGSLDDLRAVRAAVDLPLLIVAMLEQAALVDLIAQAEGLGLTPLVEVHAEDEVERALAAEARVIGINNRNLHTFEVDLAVTERLCPLVPADRTIVGESGVFGWADVARLRAAGAHAILVGEALMRAGLDGVAAKLGEFKSGEVAA